MLLALRLLFHVLLCYAGKQRKTNMAYYHLLGVDTTAPEAVIRNSYKKLARRLHPDKTHSALGSETSSTSNFQRFQRAYETLMHLQQRLWYDRLLAVGVDAAEQESDDLRTLVARHCGPEACLVSLVRTELMTSAENGTLLAVRAAIRTKFGACASAAVLDEDEGRDGGASSATQEPRFASGARGAPLRLATPAYASPSLSNETRNREALRSLGLQESDAALVREYVNERSLDTGRSAFLFAMRNPDLLERRAILRLLHALDADVNSANCGGFTAIMFAAGRDIPPKKLLGGTTRIAPLVTTELEFLVALNADVNAQTNYGLTALMVSCCKRRRTLEEAAPFFELLRLKADVRLTTDVGFDALAFAADYGNHRLVQELANRGADPDLQFFGRFDRTSLMCSAALGNVEVLQVLLDAAADLTVRDANGESALDYAARSFDDGLIVPHGLRNEKNFRPVEEARLRAEGLFRDEEAQRESDHRAYEKRTRATLVDIRAFREDSRRPHGINFYFDKLGRCTNVDLLLRILRRELRVDESCMQWETEAMNEFRPYANEHENYVAVRHEEIREALGDPGSEDSKSDFVVRSSSWSCSVCRAFTSIGNMCATAAGRVCR